MNTTPEQIADLTKAHTDAHQDLLDFANSLEKRIADKEKEVDALIANARSEYGHVCFTPNQRMQPKGDNTGVDQLNHIYMTLDVQAAAAFASGSGSANGWPNTIGQEFGEAMNCKYYNSTFYIVNINWLQTAQHSHPSRFHDSWTSGTHQGSFTEAAYIKLISGTIGGDFNLYKSYDNGWGLYGRYSTNPFYATHTGLLLTSESGQMLMAMYGKATGRVDLENGQWGLFPAINN